MTFLYFAAQQRGNKTVQHSSDGSPLLGKGDAIPSQNALRRRYVRGCVLVYS